MPYIAPEFREEIDKRIDPLAKYLVGTGPGFLNYSITHLLLEVYSHVDYRSIAEITGVLENIKQEFYRKVAAPYEDWKCAENGDVYEGLSRRNV